jgi:hypothetical protein
VISSPFVRATEAVRPFCRRADRRPERTIGWSSGCSAPEPSRTGASTFAGHSMIRITAWRTGSLPGQRRRAAPWPGRGTDIG